MTPQSEQQLTREHIYAALRDVEDPIFSCDIVELGLIAGITIEGDSVTIDVMIPHDDAYVRQQLLHDIEREVKNIPVIIAATARISKDHVWDPSLMSPSARRRIGLD